MRRSHYELAFESMLSRRGIPYVCVEEAQPRIRGRTGIKAFDYVVYPSGCKPCLVDVKGRKSILPSRGDELRQKTWVNRDDVEGLLGWAEVFGGEFQAVFVFAYWAPDGGGQVRRLADDRARRSAIFAGRSYEYWIVPVDEYARHQKRLSASWDTVNVPRGIFRGLCRDLIAAWPAAPC